MTTTDLRRFVLCARGGLPATPKVVGLPETVDGMANLVGGLLHDLFHFTYL